jgi:hypothetical protein
METLSSGADESTVSHYISRFQPFIVRNTTNTAWTNSKVEHLLGNLSKSDVMVDISCREPESNEYPGHPMHRDSVNLKLKDFVEGFLLAQSNQHHWIQETGLNLFLSQCCLYSKDPYAFKISGFEDILEERPDFLKHQEMDVINLWMNLQPSRSTLHYDANHNFLTVLKGSKHVYLISPELTHEIQVTTVFSETPNHSELSFHEIIEKMENFTGRQELTGKYYDRWIQEGEGIFIPEGWWHQVESKEFTVAINYWFYSSLQPIFANPTILPYLLRQSINRIAFSHSQDTFKKDKITYLNHRDYYNGMTSEKFSLGINQILFPMTTNQNTLEQVENLQLEIVFCSYDNMRLYWLSFAKQVYTSQIFLSFIL